MHPKALLDACAELVKLTLTFEHPADAVVSRYFRDNRQLGPRGRARWAEPGFPGGAKRLRLEARARRAAVAAPMVICT